MPDNPNPPTDDTKQGERGGAGTGQQARPPQTPANPPSPNQPAMAPVPQGQPADPNKAVRKVAVVLTTTRRVHLGNHVYHVPPGQVIRVLDLPATQNHFSDGTDTKLVDAGDLEVGDMVDDQGKKDNVRAAGAKQGDA